jgi:hypothetical protein
MSWTAGALMIFILLTISAVAYAAGHPMLAGISLGILAIPIAYLLIPRLAKSSRTSD